MGMTIDEARTALGKERKYALHENKQAFDIAIDTMRKYQKIQEIYERFQKDGAYYHHMAWLDVMEVVEDGKVD